MTKVTDYGISVIKGDVFNLLTVPKVWDDTADFTATLTGSGVDIDIECSLFRGKYVRLYKNPVDFPAGTYQLTIFCNGEKYDEQHFVVEE